MDLSSLPVDFFTKSAQFTKELHTDVYPSIDPTMPALSQAGKIVIITGASQGLGRRGIVPAFAKAHPAGLVLVARNEAQLAEAAQEVRAIDAGIKVLAVPTDVSDEASVAALFEKVERTFGRADVLINNAGIAGPPGYIHDANAQEWWKQMEVNVKGPFLMTRAFLGLAQRNNANGTNSSTPDAPATPTPTAAAIINVTSLLGLGAPPPATSAYALSKLAAAHLQQSVAAEYAHVTAVSLHPGVVDTELVLAPFRRFAIDPPALAGGVAVWLATPAARFLSGRFVDVHWSVDELVRRRDEIAAGGKLLTGLNTKLGPETVVAA